VNSSLSRELQVLQDAFDQIYVLTLDRAVDRHRHIEIVLAGVNFQFFKGVDKLTLDYDDLVARKIYDDEAHRSRKRTHRSMSLGEVACALSHRAIQKDAIDKGHERILILEDDVQLHSEHLLSFQAALSELPADWELLMLGFYGEKYPGLASSLKRQTYLAYHRLGLFNWGKVNKAFLEHLIMERYTAHLWCVGKLVGGHAYALTQSACRKLVDFQTPVFLQADRVFSYYPAFHELQAFALDKKLFSLADISEDSWIGYDSRAEKIIEKGKSLLRG
jgi:glycosyl transferase family 25